MSTISNYLVSSNIAGYNLGRYSMHEAIKEFDDYRRTRYDFAFMKGRVRTNDRNKEKFSAKFMTIN